MEIDDDPVPQVSWTCAFCAETTTTASTYKKPDKKGCKQNKKGHDWKLGTQDERKQSTKKKLEELSPEDEEKQDPSGFKQAKSWSDLAKLVKKWNDTKLATVREESKSVFSNVGSSNGAIVCADTMESGGKWAKARATAVTSVDESNHTLQHVGVLKATVLTKDNATVLTFYGAAGNVYVNSKGATGLRFIGVTPEDSKGTCHTEQLCLYRLDLELERLVKAETAFTLVTLRWFTEKQMCSQWCQPALALFTNSWTKRGVKVDSADFG